LRTDAGNGNWPCIVQPLVAGRRRFVFRFVSGRTPATFRGMGLTSINPATGKRIALYPAHTRRDIERALVRSERAQTVWRELPVRRRARWMAQLGRALRDRCEALARLATEEMGKPITQARAEVEKCAALCDYYARHGAELLADQRPTTGAAGSRVILQPLGTILAIMPWNFPYWQVMRACVPALVAGNGIVLKHAPNVPGCALALQKVFAQADFPSGVFELLLIDTQPVPALIADRRVAGVTLTGSTRAGRAVGALAGAALKPAVLELGGSDPLLVLSDADLERAAEIAAQARLLNSGQSCICAKRLIIEAPVFARFEALFLERLRAHRVGDPTDPNTGVGPLARPDLRDTLHTQVQRSVRRGATLVTGGLPMKRPGFFYEPTVLRHVGPGMPAFDEETFGPVAALVVADDEAHAIALANATDYGLGAAVFTGSRTRARGLVPQLAAGCVVVNDLVRSTPELPFGGIRQSGFGRELGSWGAQSFCNVKSVIGT
jgi:succinate-semialdehyde dehydrogenase/glutarate-semialdehyde dehydrogenase